MNGELSLKQLIRLVADHPYWDLDSVVFSETFSLKSNVANKRVTANIEYASLHADYLNKLPVDQIRNDLAVIIRYIHGEKNFGYVPRGHQVGDSKLYHDSYCIAEGKLTNIIRACKYLYDLTTPRPDTDFINEILFQALSTVCARLSKNNKNLLSLNADISVRKTPTTRWYHVSPVRFHKGDILTTGWKSFGKWRENQGCHEGVYLTSSPVPHHTIAKTIFESEKQWFVYEVSPIGEIHKGMWDDAFCPQAEIIRYIGNARGLLINSAKQRGVVPYYTANSNHKEDDVFYAGKAGSEVKDKEIWNKKKQMKKHAKRNKLTS